MHSLDPPPAAQLPVVAVAGLDRDTLEPVEAAVAMSLPRPVLARFVLDVGEGTITRVISDHSGVLEREVTHLDHACLSCALRHEMVPTLLRLADSGRWTGIVLSLPAAGPTGTLLSTLRGLLTRRSPVRVAASVAAIDGAALVDDVFGDDLLRERDPDRHAGDIRAVGEVLVDLAEQADLLVTTTPCGATGRALLDDVRRPGATVVPHTVDLTEELLLGTPRADDLPAPQSRSPRWRPHSADEVVDCTTATAAAAGLWTVAVDTWRPLHPERLMAALESLGGHSYVGRGCFWLPTRPDSLAQWSGAGGQLSIGTIPLLRPHSPRTRLVITGHDDRRGGVLRDLDAALLTEAELARGLTRWVGLDDGFDPWLGERSETA